MKVKLNKESRAIIELMIVDGIISREDAEKYFPELKSKDGRIRKEIINFLNAINKDTLEGRNLIADRYGDAIPDDMIPTWIAWLEKQGEQNPQNADSIPLDCTSDAKNENTWHKVEDSLPDNTREVLCKDAIGNFFIGRYYKNDGGCWEVSMYDEPDKSNKDNPPVLMWANIPSCEQNLANSAKTCKDEQKPADKVEPKFKVRKGKWYVCTETFVSRCKIIAIKGQTYQSQQEDDTITCEDECLFIDRHDGKASDYFRYWTIEDAKDGDVLVASDGSIFLFKSDIDGACKHYAALTTDNAVKFNEGLEHYWETSRAVHPATKEQRELLFHEMKEAGYEWNADKKELKKIEQNPAWSGEDEANLQFAIDDFQFCVDNNQFPVVYNTEKHKEVLASLKSLKERYTWKPSDEQMLQLECVATQNKDNMLGKELMTLFNDLKKLKE